jgi:hypothetical protein
MNQAGVTWESVDWAALDRLRDTFLAGKPAGTSYWRSRSDLENYDFTFAQRIAWKWDAVVRELKLRGWTPPPGSGVLDWGCGSGIAGRRVVEFFGQERFECLRVFDRSSLAMEFAAEKAHATFPLLRVERGPHPQPLSHPMGEGGPAVAGPGEGFGRKAELRRPETSCSADETGRAELRLGPGFEDAPQRVPATGESIGTLVISHVLNELDEAGEHALRQVIDRADTVLWLEPGTYADSRSLIAMREALRETFHVIAPCTHQAACGMLAAENERHWCHHFASSPGGIMGDSNWVRFAQRAGIDLRSLPYSFLVLERKGLRDPVPGLLPDGFSHIIGEPRFYKGYAKIFSCQVDGVRDLTLQKRDAPELFKALKSSGAALMQRWIHKGDRIKAA